MERSQVPNLWFQAAVRRGTPAIDPVLLIILIPLLALLFLFFLLPPFLSHASHIILKPPSSSSSAKWDSLNIGLLLFAILCGVMSRKNNDDDRDIHDFVAESSEISDPKVMSDSWRQELVCDHMSYDNRIENLNRDEDEVEVKEIVVDTFEVTTNNATERLTPPCLFPPKLLSASSVANSESDDLDKVAEIRSRHKNKTLERKVSDVATAISSFYNHTKQNTKKKKKRKIRRLRSDTSDDTTYSPPQTQEEPRQTLIVPPPPPPPPPPFPSVFKNLFKKGGKHNNNNIKRIHSIPLPPPLPPPPSSIFHNIFKSKSKRFHLPSSPNALFKINGTKSKRFNHITNSSPPFKSNQLISEPQPKILEPQIQRSKTSGYYDSSGSQSPLFPMPPPPPPFKMSDMMFEVRGDFVKVESTHSSLCSSPDHDHDLSLTIIDDGPICFPSPDVNAKADHFISRLKHEWRMERINSIA